MAEEMGAEMIMALLILMGWIIIMAIVATYDENH